MPNAILIKTFFIFKKIKYLTTSNNEQKRKLIIKLKPIYRLKNLSKQRSANATCSYIATQSPDFFFCHELILYIRLEMSFLSSTASP